MFYVTCLVIFSALFGVWSSSSAANIFIKLILLGMAGWSAFEALKSFGYIIAV